MRKTNVGYVLYYLASILCWGFYVYFTFTSPITEANNKFSLSESQIRLLQLSIVVPFFFAWLCGIYAVHRLKSYTDLIYTQEDGRGLRKVMHGILILLAGLMAGAVVGSLGNLYPDNESVARTLTIAARYIGLVFPLIGYIFMFRGARALTRSIAAEHAYRFHSFFPTLILIVFSTLYLVFFALNPIRVSSPYPDVKPTYYTSDVVTVTTLVIPYIVSWIIGFFAALNIEVYLSRVQGVFYRKALAGFVLGILTIVTLSVSLQIITAASLAFKDIDLKGILILIYAIMFVIALGYALLAYGAKQLQKLETI